MKSSEIRNKAKATNIRHHGFPNPMQNQEIQNKAKNTNRIKYGYSNPFLSPQIQQQIKKTNTHRYGTEFPMQNPTVRDRVEVTNLIRYGVPNPMHDPTIKTLHQAKMIRAIEDGWSDITITALSSKEILEDLLSQHGSYTGVANVLGDVCYQTVARRASELGISHETWVPVGEMEFRDFLTSLGVDLHTNIQTIIPPKELDFYLPTHKLAIEYCGLYWHSDQYKDPSYHQNKYIQCMNQGITLITVFEDEWIRNPEIVQSVIRAKLGLSQNMISARSCSIVSGQTDMFERYHLMGRSTYSQAFSLIHDGVEVAAMSFSSRNPARSEAGWAIDRFVTLPNTIVRGGGSKLFTAFIRANPTINKITTFADARYGNGGVYGQMGFFYNGISKPGYWNICDNYTRRVHRFNFTKKKLLDRFGGDPNKTGRELAMENGIGRIYDCGHHRYEWNRD